MSNIVPSFLTVFSTFDKFSIPLPFLWTVTVDEPQGLADNINSTLSKADYGAWVAKSPLDWTDTNNNNIFVAQDFTIPGEQIEAVSIGVDSSRGAFMPGQGISQRVDFLQRNVSINFLETNADIETMLFRPWIIALGIDGLLGGKLRSTITLTQYDRKMKMRKEYTFYGAFPTNAEGVTLNYTGDEFSVKTITFGYTNYKVKYPLEIQGYFTGDVINDTGNIA